ARTRRAPARPQESLARVVPDDGEWCRRWGHGEGRDRERVAQGTVLWPGDPRSGAGDHRGRLVCLLPERPSEETVSLKSERLVVREGSYKSPEESWRVTTAGVSAAPDPVTQCRSVPTYRASQGSTQAIAVRAARQANDGLSRRTATAGR